MSAPKSRSAVSVSAIVITLLIAVLNAGWWALNNRPSAHPDWTGKVNGLAYSGFQRDQDPTKKRFPTQDELARDMALMAQVTHRIRTYTSTENATVPRLAREAGLKVTAGAWLDTREEHNQAEIQALVQAVRENPNVDRVIVGNESILRGDVAVRDMIRYLKQVRGKVNVPVSTAEPWHIWMRYPELARNVDYITIHLLPYWEGVPVNEAVNYVLDRYWEVKRAYPRKKVVIGEVGWPSQGDRRDGAVASVENQAAFVRAFLERSIEHDLDYYFMEAFDQPWKQAHEGRAGAYWGVFHADRTPKFPLAGPVVSDPVWPAKALAASILAAPFMFFFASHFRRFKFAGKFFYCALIQAAVTLLVWLVGVPFEFYLDWLDWAMFLLLLPALVAMIAILLTNAFEFVEVKWRRKWLREFHPIERPDAPQPFVSIHLPCHNEPPEMVILTLESLKRLDYRNYEVLVLDNNTKDPAVWRPVQEWCERAGERFRFFHLDNWPGFKAGALNFGLTQTDPRAEVIGVVDADYVVEPEWLKVLTPHFAEPKVAVVQAPQAHRDYEHSPFQRMCNWEFDGFFRIGMHHRNERNAIIQHGTMTLVRRQALEATGGWAEWCICEDAELGLRLMNAGYELRYVDAVLGRGLTPAHFKAFKSQRFRWAFGAMQILKRRWNWLTKPGPLDAGQRYHFLTGWFSWFADALHLVFTVAALLWTIGMLSAPQYFNMPLDLFLLPVLGFFVCKAFFGPALYRERVNCSWLDVIGASVASMGLSHAIARGIFAGLTQKNGTFVVTAKGVSGGNWLGALAPAREEALMGCALVAGAGLTLATMGVNHREALLWSVILGAQSIPYWSAVVCAIISARDAKRSKQASAPRLAPAAPQPVPDNVIPMPSPVAAQAGTGMARAGAH